MGWGPEADSFDPDRLDPEDRSMDETSCLIPFGDGPRVCIGQILARMEVALVVAEVLKRFDIFLQDVPGSAFSYPATMRVDPGVSLIIRPR